MRPFDFVANFIIVKIKIVSERQILSYNYDRNINDEIKEAFTEILLTIDIMPILFV